MTALGMILIMTPLALWFAWTETLFVVVLAIGASAGVLYCVLTPYEESAFEDQRELPNPQTTGISTDEFFAELSSLTPCTYHHRRSGNSAFQKKMDRLLSLTQGRRGA